MDPLWPNLSQDSLHGDEVGVSQIGDRSDAS